jgi:hypothetical protein
MHAQGSRRNEGNLTLNDGGLDQAPYPTQAGRCRRMNPLRQFEIVQRRIDLELGEDPMIELIELNRGLILGRSDDLVRLV